MSMTLAIPPATPVVGIAELYAHVRREEGDDDIYLQHCLDTAIAQFDGADGELGLALVNQTWHETFADVPGCGGVIELSLAPVFSVSKVEVRGLTGEWAEADSGAVELFEDAGRFYVGAGAWPRPGKYRQPLRVEYVAGYGAEANKIPLPIRHAILLLAAHLYEVREPVSFDGVPVEVPMSIDRLVSVYKVWWQ